jgi:hypothetical protein
MKQTKDENVNGEESQTLTRIKHRIILGIALGDLRRDETSGSVPQVAL